MKRYLVAITLVLVAVGVLLPSIAYAYVSGIAVSSPSTKSYNPYLYEIETGKTYYNASGIWNWTGKYGLEYSVHPNPLEEAMIYADIVECSNLAEGYEQFPLEYCSMPSEVYYDNTSYWEAVLMTLSLPDEPEFYNKHYQICVEFKVQTSENTWACVGATTYMVTPELEIPEPTITPTPTPTPSPEPTITIVPKVSKHISVHASIMSILARFFR